MRRLAEGLYALAIALWVGGAWAIGFIAAPSLFASVGDRVLAGELAGNLFVLIGWTGMACAAYLLAFLVARKGWKALGSSVFWLVLAMLLLVLASHFGIQPILAKMKAEAWPLSVMQSVAKDRFASWHGVAGGLFVLQGLLGAALVLLQDRGR